MPACSNGHPMTSDERFCLQCGAPAPEGSGTAASLLPPFDPDRFRHAASAGRDVEVARTVPFWVLVAVIVVGVALGVVLGAVR